MGTPTPIPSLRLQKYYKETPPFPNNNLPEKQKKQPVPEPRVVNTHEPDHNNNTTMINKYPPTPSAPPTLSPTSNPIPVTLPSVKPKRVHLPPTEAQYTTIYKDTFAKKILNRLKKNKHQ